MTIKQVTSYGLPVTSKKKQMNSLIHDSRFMIHDYKKKTGYSSIPDVSQKGWEYGNVANIRTSHSALLNNYYQLIAYSLWHMVLNYKLLAISHKQALTVDRVRRIIGLRRNIGGLSTMDCMWSVNA